MPDADGDQLDRRACFDVLDDLAQMTLKIIAGVDRQRRIVNRGAVGNHHQDPPLLRPPDKSAMRPGEGLSVDVFLQQSLAHHQAQIAPGTPPRCFGRLVDDVPEIVQAAGLGWLAGPQPGFARLAALPCPGGEAEDFHLHAATFQRAGQNIRAGSCHGDRAAAHGSRIVQQKGHDGIAKISIPFRLEGQGMQGIDDHAGQASGVENPLLQVEIPGAALLRHQLALEAVRQPPDRALKVDKLLVEIAAEAIQFGQIAKVFSLDRLVETPGEGLIGLVVRRGRESGVAAFGFSGGLSFGKGAVVIGLVRLAFAHLPFAGVAVVAGRLHVVWRPGLGRLGRIPGRIRFIGIVGVVLVLVVLAAIRSGLIIHVEG